MDLLLHLITKHKLNIYDIPIAELVDQYSAYIRQMQEADMDIASEFLETAARLVHIKSLSLLPVYEEAEVPRAFRDAPRALIQYRVRRRKQRVTIHTRVRTILLSCSMPICGW